MSQKQHTGLWDPRLTEKIGKVILLPGIACLIIGLIGVIQTENAWENSAASLSVNEPAEPLTAYALLAIFGIIATLGWWVTLWGYRYFDQTFTAASKPVPSPAYIAQEMRKELGREPTFQEVAAVQQMLHNEHNQALVNAGISLGALYLIGHKGKL